MTTPVHAHTLYAILRAAGIPSWKVEVLTWCENENGERKSTGLPIRALAVLRDVPRILPTVKAVLAAKGYALIPIPPHKGKHPTFGVLPE